MIERKIIVPVEVTPEELAHEFCQMDDLSQATFFNAVAKLTEKWDVPFCFQLQSVIDNEILTREGRIIMEQIGHYGAEYNT